MDVGSTHVEPRFSSVCSSCPPVRSRRPSARATTTRCAPSICAKATDYLAQHKPLEAIIEYRIAAQLGPSSGETRKKLGGAYLLVKDTTHALPEFVRAADLLPRDLRGPADRGQAPTTGRTVRRCEGARQAGAGTGSAERRRGAPSGICARGTPGPRWRSRADPGCDYDRSGPVPYLLRSRWRRALEPPGRGSRSGVSQSRCARPGVGPCAGGTRVLLLEHAPHPGSRSHVQAGASTRSRQRARQPDPGDADAIDESRTGRRTVPSDAGAVTADDARVDAR